MNDRTREYVDVCIVSGIVLALAVLGVDSCHPLFIRQANHDALIVSQSGTKETTVYYGHHDPPTVQTNYVCDVMVEGLDLPLRCKAGTECCDLVRHESYDVVAGQHLLNAIGCNLTRSGHCCYTLINASQEGRSL